MTLERFKEWVEDNYPSEKYDNVDDLIRDVENRVNGDGHVMNDQIKQMLLDEFSMSFSNRPQAPEREPEIMSIGEGFASNEPIGQPAQKQSAIQVIPEPVPEEKPSALNRLKTFFRRIFR